MPYPDETYTHFRYPSGRSSFPSAVNCGAAICVCPAALEKKTRQTLASAKPQTSKTFLIVTSPVALLKPNYVARRYSCRRPIRNFVSGLIHLVAPAPAHSCGKRFTLLRLHKASSCFAPQGAAL